jgi:porphyrinogen peroxidase
VGALAGLASLAEEVAGFTYLDSRDLTGFIDGTENPPLDVAADAALVAEGRPGASSSVALVQRWRHDLDAFHALPVDAQERVIGRTKPDSVEYDDDAKPADAHISRVVIEDDEGEELEILRRSIPIGGMRDHGLEFVAFTADQQVLLRMLHRMAGVGDGVRDHLTRFSTPRTGAFYVVPSVDALKAFAPPDDDD